MTKIETTEKVNRSGSAILLRFFGALTIVGGIIAGIALEQVFIGCITGIVSGTLFIGMGEIIDFLLLLLIRIIRL